MTSHDGHPHACPHERQVRKFDQPRRLSRTIALRASVSASCVRGCSARARLAHVDDLDRRQRRAVDARGQAQARAARGPHSGRGVALPATSTAPGLRGAALGHAARVVARVALVLVGRVVLLVDDDQARARASGRRRPSAGRRRPAPPPPAAAPTRRGARPPRASSAGRRRCRRSARRSATTICGVSAISGTSTITPRPCAERLARRPAGRPRSCPSR